MARIINFEGRRISVPDDATDDEVAEIIGATTPTTAAKPDIQPQKSEFRKDYPVLAGVGDVASGMSSIPRGALNIVGKAFTGSKWGDILMPQTEVDKESLLYTAGQILDPSAMAVGGAAGTAAKFIPRIGQYARNVAGGVAGGGAIGGLSDEGDAATGAAVGGTVSAALPILGRAAGKVTDIATGRGGDIRAGRILREAGADATTLAQAPAGLNVAQAMGTEAPAAVSALQNVAAKYQPDAALAMKAAQENARRAAMTNVAGGATATQSRQAQGAAFDAATAEFKPGMTTELNAANEANRQLARMTPQLAQKRTSEISALQGEGRAATESAQRGVSAAEGKPGFLTQGDRAAEFADVASDFATIKAQRQAEREFIENKIGSLEAHGLKPLSAEPIIAKIDSLMSNVPGLTNDLLSGVKSTIQETARNNNGRLDAYDLYEIRKNEINSTITRMLKDSGNSEKARASDLAGKVKKAIDDAIIDAGGTDWKTHLNKYALGMRSIERQKMGQTAMGMSDKKLIGLVEGNEPKAVEKIFGPGKYDFTAQMGEKAAPFQRAASELQRDITLAEKAAAGGDKAGKIILDNLFTMHLPNLLRQDISLINRAMEAAGSRINRSTVEKLSKAMYDPAEAARVIRTLPMQDRNAILRAMTDPTVTGAAAGMMTGANE
jgi:hypothetical protein